nr:hypothetical protein [Candidatus Sigynarchaeota archaeon]
MPSSVMTVFWMMSYLSPSGHASFLTLEFHVLLERHDDLGEFFQKVIVIARARVKRHKHGQFYDFTTALLLPPASIFILCPLNTTSPATT